MHRTLYELAGPAIVAWLLLILLPKWRVTRWLAQSAVFPIYLSILYVIGITMILRDTGPGIMQDFGSMEGVLRILAREDVALIAWIHILAFDQFVGLYLYRDNMQHRYVPLPIQSVLLFFTLMFGPVGFVTYFIVRFARRTAARGAPAVRSLLAAADPFPDPGGSTAHGSESRFDDARGIDSRGAGADVVEPFGRTRPGGVLDDRIADMPSPIASPLRYITHVWFHAERAIAATGALGVLLAAGIGVIALVHGPVIEPEGVLSKPFSFDLAIGIYTLTIVLFVPLARFPLVTLPRWRTAVVGFTLLLLGIENVQSLRGLDPRFSEVAGSVDQIVGLSFFLFANVTIGLFWILGARFFDLRRAEAEQNLARAIRYACVATALAFVAGYAMSIVSGRFVGRSGNLLTLHALGFHGLQAIPLVAILVTRASLSRANARRWIDAAGLTWCACCLLVAAQTAAGLSIAVPTIASIGAVVLLLAWVFVTIRAVLLMRRNQPHPA
ncbi:MAG: ABA4-like family protein [Longimicrobiales bacterium]